jgi:serine/threonine-protein kinase
MPGNAGVNGPATSAQLANPEDSALDAAGNLYIADTGNNVIRRVGRDGTITTLAGTGVRGFSPDGGPAVQAPLDNPSSVAVDSSGAVYLGEIDSGRVRRIDPSGTISTVAGTGAKGYSGDGGPATKAQLSEPTGLDVRPDGTLYVFDQGNNTVRTVAPSGVITTVAGTGAAGFSGDGGPARSAQLSQPINGGLDAAGNVYIADAHNLRVRKVDRNGTITTIAGTGVVGYPDAGTVATAAALSDPVDVTVDNRGRLLVTDANASLVYLIDTNGILSIAAGSTY